MFVMIAIHAYFIRFSQGIAETHLRCGGI